MAHLYGYPDIGRFGLGHSMLAWARCEVWCRNNDAQMLGPRWFRPRIGPYLRRERDKREYFRLFDNKGYVGEPWRTALLATARKVPAEAAASVAYDGRNTVVVFKNAVGSNFEKHFHEVRGHGPVLYDAFRRITRKKYLPEAPAAPFLAVHVRLGDFSRFDVNRAEVGTHNQRLPIEWYCDSLVALREALGTNMRARVFSDGDDTELAPLLSLPDVRRANDAESVTHMLEMTQASAIIGAGSNFNLWAAFFGQVPRITYPNQAIVAVNDDPARETSFHDEAPLPEVFVKQVRTQFTNREKQSELT
ncbi:hypothetical protein [Mesorhizobium helmanticense]|uniref:Alpha-1,2-fucosyltransferase n=1 Tax=Mesorhizobium helmanticense TaxID=1776423 RepID=A0A2T4IV01_9HYPH|nr:hypothetical protein [Mesorhizobium helmanticense]PTE09484.1 hypothetical protein C9427_15430 [Mesorhizobium helmanticense]